MEFEVEFKNGSIMYVNAPNKTIARRRAMTKAKKERPRAKNQIISIEKI